MTGAELADLAKADPRITQAFPILSELQIMGLEPYGKPVSFKQGEAVWRAGSVDMCMYVVREGELDIVDGRTSEHIVTHEKGAFSGDVDILSGRASVVSGIAKTDLELLEVPNDCVRSIVAERPDIGEIILRAFLIRRALLIETHTAGVLVMGSRYSSDTLRIREFLTRNHYPVVWEDLEDNPQTDRLLQEFQVTEDQTPIVVLKEGRILRVPSNGELAYALGIARPVEAKIYDLVIIGAGPSGLAAAVYGASEGLSTLVLDSIGPGGQAGTSSRIENYMGFPLGVTGQELADSALLQAEKFGARIVVPANVNRVGCNPLSGHEIDVDCMGTIECKCVILAPGAQYRKLDVPRMEQFEGRGIYYAATHVERVLCGNSQIVVVGGGNSAGQAAVFMAEAASHVFLVYRGDDLRKSMSSYLANRIERSNKITVLLDSEISTLIGEDHLEGTTFTNRATGETRTEVIGGIFVMIGAVPHTDWLPDQITRDAKGFIVTGPTLVTDKKWSLDRPPFFLETSCPGVFAVGDARANSIKRVASAVGEGSMAVAFVHQFLAT